jgi:hypothetical protein
MMKRFLLTTVLACALIQVGHAAPFNPETDADGLMDCFIYQQAIDALADPERTPVPEDAAQWLAIGEEMRAVLEKLQPQFGALDATYGKNGVEGLFQEASDREMVRLRSPDAGETYLAALFDGAVGCAAKADAWNPG